MPTEIKSEIRVIPASLLKPHELAARCGTCLDDKEREAAAAALKADIAAAGIRTPIVVVRDPDAKDGFLVVDGCTRLAAAQELAAARDGHGAPETLALPCEVLAIAPGDVADEVYRRNLLRKPYSASQRAVLYCDMHRGEVLAAAETDSKPGRPKNGSKIIDTKCVNYSSRSISDRLGINYNDIQSAVEMVRCVNSGKVPRASGNGPVILVDATPEEAKQLDEVYTNVLKGETPVRRWRPAITGKVATEDQAKTRNYSKHAMLAVKGFKTACCEDWKMMTGDFRVPFREIVSQALASCPRDLAEQVFLSVAARKDIQKNAAALLRSARENAKLSEKSAK